MQASTERLTERHRVNGMRKWNRKVQLDEMLLSLNTVTLSRKCNSLHVLQIIFKQCKPYSYFMEQGLLSLHIQNTCFILPFSIWLSYHWSQAIQTFRFNFYLFCHLEMFALCNIFCLHMYVSNQDSIEDAKECLLKGATYRCLLRHSIYSV